MSNLIQVLISLTLLLFIPLLVSLVIPGSFLWEIVESPKEPETEPEADTKETAAQK